MYFFWESHQEHHKYTLHPPDDLEVVLPVHVTFTSYLGFAFVNPKGFYNRMKSVIRLCLGHVDGEWANLLFSTWRSRKNVEPYSIGHVFMLMGHILLVIISLYLGLWMIPVLVTLAPFYGAGFSISI